MTADIRTDVRVAVTCKAQPRPTTSLFDICSRSRPPSLPPCLLTDYFEMSFPHNLLLIFYGPCVGLLPPLCARPFLASLKPFFIAWGLIYTV
jgi:hypothetical protein